MTRSRGLALGSLLLVAAIALVVVLSSGGGHTYHLLFANAGQLVPGDQVQVGGRAVGSVDSIDLTPDNQARVSITVDDDFGRLHRGSRAVVRATSLSGIANRYVLLVPAPNSPNPALPDGATIPALQTTSIVDLDQLFNTLDAPTRRALQQIVSGSATQYRGAEAATNVAAHYLNPALSGAARLTGELDRDQSLLTELVVSGSRVVQALAARRSDLTDLVSNAGATTGAIGAEAGSLDQALRTLPGALRQARTTLAHLRPALDDLDTLVAVAKPATRRLPALLSDVRPLVHDAVPTIADLRALIRRAGADNDLIDLLDRLPRLARVSRADLPRAVGTLRQAQPVIEFIRPYTPELVGWLRDFGQGASTYDANGHYARIQPIFNAFSVSDSPAGTLLTPLTGRPQTPALESGKLKRCPGGATQPRPDAGNPYTDGGALDCDPSQSPPGP